PASSTDPIALEKVKEIWEKTGAEVILMNADKHDRYLAAVSHLPHVVAYALVNSLGEIDKKEGGILSFSAGGLRDFTRIAASHPGMWRDICLMNKRDVADMITFFQSTLQRFKERIIDGDGDGLEREFADAREIKCRINRDQRRIIIAIDGPAASGKSTIARMLAKKINYKHVDTGAMYRAVALKSIENQIQLTEEDRVSKIADEINIDFMNSNYNQKIYVNGEDITLKIRDEKIGNGASIVSAYSGVRNAMLLKQREMGKSGGIVMEGRDIGTVVFPNADLKFFLNASIEERGRRRYIELKEKGEDVQLHEVIEEVKMRDEQDIFRHLSPLKMSDDSIVIDTTGISIDEVVENMLQEVYKIVERVSIASQ
ncbi:MAG: (d)CMP kinase, partial [Nitrospinota bacterium]